MTPETFPPPPNVPTIPDVRHWSTKPGAVVVRVAIPAALVSALVSAGASFLVSRLSAPAPESAAELRGDVKALTVKVDALATAQRDLLERINRDQDAAANARLVEALKVRGGGP